jgi:2,4-dienoyl-CoA reductase-like NADH-dependent reductase (Old Yellow Enzyme family)
MKLLGKATLGKLTLKNSMVMSAMTRSRADQNGMVGDMTVQYYTQRAGAGMMFTEAIRISEEATGSPLTPGIYTPEQITTWKKVTQAVHAHGGLIVAQLWHTGRAGHSIDRNGKLPLAPSALQITGAQHFTSQGPKEYETPQEITMDEIQQTISDYGQAAKSAIEAGFDGVELHAANGYLPSQFLAESANQRIDDYEGSIPNNRLPSNVNGKKAIKYCTCRHPASHTIHFAGEAPCNHQGGVISVITHSTPLIVNQDGLPVNHLFSNKPSNGYTNHYDKFTTYIKILSAWLKHWFRS